MCGAVRFRVTAPLETAGYCHCKRCQRRSGAAWSLNGLAPAEGFEIVQGADAVRTYRPDDGRPKSFCVHCGSQVFGGDPATQVVVRLGAIDGDPGVRPQWHQWVESAPDWEPLPDDGLPRFPRKRETG